jgi:hypothetical protein
LGLCGFYDKLAVRGRRLLFHTASEHRFQNFGVTETDRESEQWNSAYAQYAPV